MILAKKFEENRLTIIGTAILLLLLGAGLQSGIFSSREAMEQFLRQTGVLAPLCFLLLQTIQVVIPVVPGGVSCIIGVAMFSGKTLWADLSFKVCIRRNFSEIHFLDRKGKEIRYILSSGFDSSRYA